MLSDLGEQPIPSWTKIELRHRIAEKTGEDMSHNLKSKNKALSPSQVLIKELNKASNKKKADLVEFCTMKLGMSGLSNRTIAQLQMDAMKRIMETTPAHPYDQVGFGKYSERYYHEILTTFPDYGKWIKTTYAENGSSCEARLQRLAIWLEEADKEEFQTARPTMPSAKGYAKKIPEVNPPGSSSSSSIDPGQALLTEMMGAIRDLRQEVAALKQEPVRKKPMKSEESEIETDGSFTKVGAKKP